jgi:hypothetical protein
MPSTETRAILTRVRHGEGRRADTVYAELRNADTDELMVSATLDYILLACAVRRWKLVAKE